MSLGGNGGSSHYHLYDPIVPNRDFKDLTMVYGYSIYIKDTTYV